MVAYFLLWVCLVVRVSQELVPRVCTVRRHVARGSFEALVPESLISEKSLSEAIESSLEYEAKNWEAKAVSDALRAVAKSRNQRPGKRLVAAVEVAFVRRPRELRAGSREISQAAWALATLEASGRLVYSTESRRAMAATAQRFQEIYFNATARDAATCAWAFARAKKLLPPKALTKSLAVALNQLLTIDIWAPHDAANAAWACAVVKVETDLARKVLDRAALLLNEDIGAFGAQGLANLVWAETQLGLDQGIADLVGRRAAHLVSTTPFQPRSAAEIAWALATRYRRRGYSTQADDLFFDALLQLWTKVHRHEKTPPYAARDLAACAWALMATGHDEANAFQAIAYAAVAAPRRAWSPQSASNLLWAISSSANGPKWPRLYDQLGNAILSSRHCTPTDLASLAWALAAAGIRNDNLFLHKFIPKFAHEHAVHADPRCQATIAAAVAFFYPNHEDTAHLAFDAIAQHAKLDTFDARELATTAAAFFDARQGPAKSTAPLLLAAVASTTSKKFLKAKTHRLPIRDLVQLAAVFASAKHLIPNADFLVTALADLALDQEISSSHRFTLCRALLTMNKPRHPLLATADKQLATRLRETTATILLPTPRDQAFFLGDFLQGPDQNAINTLQLAPPALFSNDDDVLAYLPAPASSSSSEEKVSNTLSVEILGVMEYDDLFEVDGTGDIPDSSYFTTSAAAEGHL